jgi:hypothetical protein
MPSSAAKLSAGRAQRRATDESPAYAAPLQVDDIVTEQRTGTSPSTRMKEC